MEWPEVCRGGLEQQSVWQAIKKTGKETVEGNTVKAVGRGCEWGGKSFKRERKERVEAFGQKRKGNGFEG